MPALVCQGRKLLSVSLVLLFIDACWAAPMPLHARQGGYDLPSTMMAVKDRGSTPCVRPVHGKNGSFSCMQPVTVNVPKHILPGFALIRMNISSVNPSDVDMVENKIGKFLGTLGVDFAGVVVKVGPLCSKLKVGDAVWGATKGAYAEYVNVLCAITSKLGDVLPRDVGTLPEVSMTSAQALKKAGAPWGANTNKTIVITSGSGGTGFAAVQLAKAYGAATVITATGGSVNAAFLKSIGADVVVDYHEHDLFSTLANNSVDVVYDNFGAAGTADKAMACLKPGGVYVFLPGLSGGGGGGISKHPKQGVKQINYGIMIPSASLLDELLVLHKEGKLNAHLTNSYPLSNVSGAFTESAAGHVVGKLAIIM